MHHQIPAYSLTGAVTLHTVKARRFTLSHGLRRLSPPNYLHQRHGLFHSDDDARPLRRDSPGTDPGYAWSSNADWYPLKAQHQYNHTSVRRSLHAALVSHRYPGRYPDQHEPECKDCNMPRVRSSHHRHTLTPAAQFQCF